MLEKAARVIACDLRGMGDSHAMPPPYDMPTHAQDVIAVLDALDIPSATFAGHSFGGYVALEILRSNVERVDALCLVAASLAADDAAAAAARMAQADAFESNEKRAGLVNAWLPLAFGSKYVEHHPDAMANAKRIIARASISAVGAMIREVAHRHDARSMAARARIPITALASRADALVGFEDLRMILNERVRLLPDSGHMIPLERPHAVAEAISGLLRSRSARAH